MKALQSVLDFPLFADRKLLAFSPASSTAAEHNRQSNSYNLNRATFDSDLVVISAALFCTLVCALGLNSLLKCALGRGRPVVLQSSDHDVAISLANTGLKKEAMTELPIIVCNATSNPPAMSRDCPICLGEFVDGEKLRLMPKCSHSFHMECIDQWLFSNSSCPVCRHCLNLHSEDKKEGGAIIAEAFESNNAMHLAVIID